MEFPPKPKTPYILGKEQDRRIFGKLAEFANLRLTAEQEKLISFLYTQLETDWRTPLEIYADELFKKVGTDEVHTT